MSFESNPKTFPETLEVSIERISELTPPFDKILSSEHQDLPWLRPYLEAAAAWGYRMHAKDRMVCEYGSDDNVLDFDGDIGYALKNPQ
jgi:hypothetical protein